MSERRQASSKPNRDVVVRHHSPYCESTGPVVQEGTVAARIQALQHAQRDNEETLRSHTPTSPIPPCRLTPVWRPNSALDSQNSPVSNGPDILRAHTQLASYVRNDLPDLREEIVTGMVHNRSLIFGSPRSRRKSLSTPGDWSTAPTHEDSLQSPRTKLPETEEGPISRGRSVRRHSSWRNSIRGGSVGRSRKSIYDISSGPGPANELQSATSTGQQESWLEKRPVLRKVSTVRPSEVPKPSRPIKSIAEQIGEMIDRALEGRTDSMGRSTPESSVPEFSGISGQVREGKFNWSNMPQRDEEHPVPLTDNTAGSNEAVERQEATDSLESDKRLLPLKTGSIHSRRLDGRYSHTDEVTVPQSSFETADNTRYRSSAEETERPKVHARNRAHTYSHRHPSVRHLEGSEGPSRARSNSSPPVSCQGKLLCNNDKYEVFVRKRACSGEPASEEKHSFIVSDRSRKQSMRSQASKVRRASSHHSSERLHTPGPQQKKRRWWKLVLIDKEASRGDQSGIESDYENREKSSWGNRSHPLANCGTDDEGYETSDLVEALERACAEQPPSPVRPAIARDKPSSALTTHTLAQCGHEDEDEDEDGEIQGEAITAVDGSSDAEHHKAALAVPTDTRNDAASSNTQVNVVSEASGARVEVVAGGVRTQEANEVSRNFRGVKVIVTVEEGMDSAIVKVEIRPKRR